MFKNLNLLRNAIICVLLLLSYQVAYFGKDQKDGPGRENI